MNLYRQKCKICQSGYAAEVDELLRQGKPYNEIIFLMKDKIPGLKSTHITAHKKHPTIIESEITGLQQTVAAVRQSITAPMPQMPFAEPVARHEPLDDMQLLDRIKEKATTLLDSTNDPGSIQKLAMVIIEIIRLKYEVTGTIYAPPPKVLALEH
ncbi:MAG: hypothetical protein LUQ13_00465 [Methanomicrobiales archaeon]|nr:hypothetical protein [Methanomicrobiales archaeon]